MEQQETATLASPAETPEGSLDTEATLQSAPQEAQAESTTEPTSPEGEEGGVEPEPPAWASVSDAEALFEHESIQPLYEERLNAARETAKKEGHSDAHRRMQTLFERQSQDLGEIKANADRFTREWQRLTRAKDETGNPAVDPARLQDLLDDNAGVFAKIAEVVNGDANWVGAMQLVNTLAQAMKSPEFGQDFGPRLDRFRRGLEDQGLFAEMVEAIATGAKKPLQQELAEAKAQIKRLEDDVRASKRNSQPPPAEPGGGATRAAGSAWPRNETEARNLHATGQWTTRQMREWLRTNSR